MTLLTAQSPEVVAFLNRWHEAGRAEFERWHDRLVYDEYAPKVAKDRKKYTALDRGNEVNRSGVFLVERETGRVFSIKGYGVPNRFVGMIGEMFTKKAA